jgi:hypothetical protein
MEVVMKKFILSLSIVAVATAGSAQGMSSYEEMKQGLRKIKAITLASDALFCFSAACLAQAMIPGPNCVTVPAMICTKTLAASPAALPILGIFYSGIVSTGMRMVTFVAKAAKISAKANSYTV